MTVPEGHRFEATQALRQVLGRAVAWKIIDLNPATVGVENPQRMSRVPWIFGGGPGVIVTRLRR